MGREQRLRVANGPLTEHTRAEFMRRAFAEKVERGWKIETDLGDTGVVRKPSTAAAKAWALVAAGLLMLLGLPLLFIDSWGSLFGLVFVGLAIWVLVTLKADREHIKATEDGEVVVTRL